MNDHAFRDYMAQMFWLGIQMGRRKAKDGDLLSDEQLEKACQEASRQSIMHAEAFAKIYTLGTAEQNEGK